MKSMKLVFLAMLVATISLAEPSAFEKIKKMKTERNTTKAALTVALAAFTAQAEALVEQREDHMITTGDLADDINNIANTLNKTKLTK